MTAARMLLGTLIATAVLAAAEPAAKLPFVYTKWKHFTVENGLPNDHIFAVKADGPRVWVGTENGLAMIDKRTGKIRSWTEKDGLPWRVITGIDIDKKTGDVWLALFGGGRFDHWHQLNSGLVNDVVYAVAVQDDNVWAATTAGASRYNTKTHEWTIFTEKNAPMEEIWNYGVNYNDGRVYLAVWGSGILEFDVKTERWKDYLDPDGEMEIDLYRNDGIPHVITTGVSYVDKIMWMSSYFGVGRYDGRNWNVFYNQDSGTPSDFVNNVKARSGNEAYFATDKGLGACMDVGTNTWVTYTRDGKRPTGKAVVYKDRQVIATIETEYNLPHNYTIALDVDGNDIWVGTSKGLGWGIGEGYYPGLREQAVKVAQTKGGAK